jgi:hypothetical protein
MFCPRCGQQAVEGVRFCSRCGLPLAAAAELVESGGELARREGAAAELTPRQRGARKGLTVTAGGLLFFGVAALLTAYRDELFPFLIIAGVIITVGVMRMLYGLLLEGHAPVKKSPQPSAELPLRQAGAAELPHARAVPAAAYAKPGARTSDMAAPSSVTEGTTKFLDESEPGGRP